MKQFLNNSVRRLKQACELIAAIFICALEKPAGILRTGQFSLLFRWLKIKIIALTQNGPVRSLVKLIVVSGNLFFICWIFFNGYNERFADTFVQIIRYAILIGLLAANTLLLMNRKRHLSK